MERVQEKSEWARRATGGVRTRRQGFALDHEQNFSFAPFNPLPFVRWSRELAPPLLTQPLSFDHPLVR